MNATHCALATLCQGSSPAPPPAACAQVPNTQVRTYVHGALYALVAEPSILEAAQRRGLADVLAAVAAASAPLFQRHIAHILARLEDAADGAGARGGGADESDGDEGDDADDVDAMHYDDEYEEMEAAMTSGAPLCKRACVVFFGSTIGGRFRARLSESR